MFAFLLQVWLYVYSDGAYLLLKEHGVDGLPTRQDHHGESHSHRHHKSYSNHLRYQIGWEVHKNISSNVFCETDVTKEPHLVQKKGNKQGWGNVWSVTWLCDTISFQVGNGDGCVCVCKCFSAHSDVEDGDNVESWAEDGAHAFDGRLVQAIVGWQHLPVKDKWADNKTVCCLTRGNKCRCMHVMSRLPKHTHKCHWGGWGDVNVLILVTAPLFIVQSYRGPSMPT